LRSRTDGSTAKLETSCAAAKLSLGPGELLRDKMNSVVIAHGLFSLLDAFAFQHPEAPALNVSIPLKERLFGQGARARFANVVVTIEDKTVKDR